MWVSGFITASQSKAFFVLTDRGSCLTGAIIHWNNWISPFFYIYILLFCTFPLHHVYAVFLQSSQQANARCEWRCWFTRGAIADWTSKRNTEQTLGTSCRPFAIELGAKIDPVTEKLQSTSVRFLFKIGCMSRTISDSLLQVFCSLSTNTPAPSIKTAAVRRVLTRKWTVEQTTCSWFQSVSVQTVQIHFMNDLPSDRTSSSPTERTR